MKKATLFSITVTTVFYLLCGCMGYASFGDFAPGNLLTGFGFYNPYWLLDIANIAIVVHLVGAYQVYIYTLKHQLEIELLYLSQIPQKWELCVLDTAFFATQTNIHINCRSFASLYLHL
jgi:hypothetical protein